MAVRAYSTTDNPSSDRLARRALAAAIERAIALLDEMDGDSDLEDGGDAEPQDEDGSELDINPDAWVRA